MLITWPEILALLGGMQGILLAILLYTRSYQRLANRVLAIFTLLFAAGILESFLVKYDQPLLIFTSEVIGGTNFLYGPLIYLYVYVLLGKSPALRQWVKHLAIFAIYTLLTIWTFVVELQAGIEPASEDGIQELVLIMVLFIQIFFYHFKALQLLRENPHPKLPVWLKYLIIGFILIYGISFSGTLLLIFGMKVNPLVFTLVQVSCVLMVYLLSYLTLAQGQNGREEKFEKYQGSPLSPTDKQVYLDKVLNYMHNYKPYLQPNVTIASFSEELGINRYYISQVINESRGQNFSDFINSYRVEETKRLLQNPEKKHLKILAIAYEAGFNSKTSFNTIFKKLTGMSPSEYRKKVQS